MLAEILTETLSKMKLPFLLALFGTTIILSNCHKSNDNTNARAKLNAMKGTWKIRSARCYQNPNVLLGYPPDAYLKFNSDLTGFTYNGSVTNQYNNFTYDLLEDDSTLVVQSLSLGGNADTSVITILTATEFIFHGKNTYAHGLTPCINGNVLDSLYK